MELCSRAVVGAALDLDHWRPVAQMNPASAASAYMITNVLPNIESAAYARSEAEHKLYS